MLKFGFVLLWLLLASASPRLRAQDNKEARKKSSSPRPQRCTGIVADENPRKIRIFYLILLHNERIANDAVHLFRAIRDPQNIVLIHVDRKASHLLDKNLPLWKEIELCDCESRVRIESIYDCQWSTWSMNLPTLWGLRVAVEDYADEWDRFINLAGDTLPVYEPETLADILAELPYNFVTSSSCVSGLIPTNIYSFPRWWHKRRHYTRDDSEPDPRFFFKNAQSDVTNELVLVTHFGSQWLILEYGFCRWLVEELSRYDSLASQFSRYLEVSEKLMSDEVYIPTLLMHVPENLSRLPPVDERGYLYWKNGTLSTRTAVRYERMDEHMPTALGHLWTQQRYDVPNSSLVEKPRPWGPYFLGVYDLANIRSSGALFIRKVSSFIDQNLLHLLPVGQTEEIPPIQWPNELMITRKPNWSALFRASSAASAGEDEEL